MKNNNSNSTSNNTSENSTNRINLDYDFNTEFGDGDIPRIDKNSSQDSMSNGITCKKPPRSKSTRNS